MYSVIAVYVRKGFMFRRNRKRIRFKMPRFWSLGSAKFAEDTLFEMFVNLLLVIKIHHCWQRFAMEGNVCRSEISQRQVNHEISFRLSCSDFSLGAIIRSKFQLWFMNNISATPATVPSASAALRIWC